MAQLTEHISFSYSSLLLKPNELNDKIYEQIVLVQAIGFHSLDEGFLERVRFRMKNEAKVLYRMVLDNLDILKQHKAGKIEKNTLQKKYARIMTEELEERILRALD